MPEDFDDPLPPELFYGSSPAPGDSGPTIEELPAGELDLDQGEARDQRDLELLNGNAKELNREAEDVLGYQTDWWPAKWEP
ncbi:MAG TPA: hypothetical protein VF017_23460 [Thermoanaerobaculia bacterium]|nr:hypothetical protein [Thermoanaerobaculia bacterium]